jgi:hypothetical protein
MDENHCAVFNWHVQDRWVQLQARSEWPVAANRSFEARKYHYVETTDMPVTSYRVVKGVSLL